MSFNYSPNNNHLSAVSRRKQKLESTVKKLFKKKHVIIHLHDMTIHQMVYGEWSKVFKQTTELATLSY